MFAVESSAVAGYQLSEGSVTGTKIAPGSVSGSSLRELSVTNGKIAHAAVGTANIQDAAITRAQIADAAVGTAQIGQAAITQALIGAEAVGTTQIADGSITDAKIVELTANKINAGTLSVERLELVGSRNSVVYALNNSGDLVSQNVDTLDGDVLTERSITGDKIVANAITANEIASRTITSNEILAGTITGGEIAANTIEGSNIKAGAITTNHVASNFGQTLDLSSNTGINQRVEQVYSDMDELVGFRIEIIATSDILSEDIQTTTLTARVWHGSENVTVSDCFARSGDDSFSAKTTNTEHDLRHVRFENCVGWSDKCRAFGITGEVYSPIEDVVFTDCAVLYRNATWDNNRVCSLAVSVEYGGAAITDVLFENIEIYRDTGRAIFVLITNRELRDCKIKGVVFRNVRYRADVKGRIASVIKPAAGDKVRLWFFRLLKQTLPFGWFDGKLEQPPVNGNEIEVTFDNVTANGRKLNRFNFGRFFTTSGNEDLIFH